MVKQTGPVTLRLAYPFDRLREALAETLAASDAKIGITLKPTGVAWSDINASSPRFRRIYGKAQLDMIGWVADYPSMDNFLYPLFDSHGGAYPPYVMSYSNHDVDALPSKARATPQQEARMQLYAEAEQKILADAPAILVWVAADCRLINSRVANLRFNSMAWADLWRAWVR